MGISGAHMNPAVTLAMGKILYLYINIFVCCVLIAIDVMHINMCITVVIRKLSWKKILGYWIAQYLAAFLSSAIVFGVYYGKFCIMLNAFVCVFIILFNTCT